MYLLWDNSIIAGLVLFLCSWYESHVGCCAMCPIIIMHCSGSVAGCRREDPVMEDSAMGLWMISTELEHKSRRRVGLS